MSDGDYIVPYISEISGDIEAQIYDEHQYNFFINGIAVEGTGQSIKSYASPYIFNFRIDSELNKKFCTGKITVQFKKNSSEILDGDGQLIIYVSDDDTQQLQEYVNEEQNTNGRLNSFMLLRTNPKLTGNIKIVVDNEGILYMDTFKASSVLNNRVYRKYPISSYGNYPHDVMTVF